MFIQPTQHTHIRHPLTSMKGFTLTELMIVIAIIGILASIALPAYQNSITKSRRADAQGALLGFANAMERHFTTNSSYLGAAGTQASPIDTGSPWIFSSRSPVDTSTTFYNLTISTATATMFTLTATPTGPQVGDGIMTIDHTGARRWDENNDGSFSATDNNWEID